jgi:hypothetical protein
MPRAPRRRAVAPSLLALLCLVFAVSGHAQEAGSTLPRIHIFAAGGLLGQFDGMPEYPGGSFDKDVGAGIHPYGGLEGLVDWWTAHKAQQRHDLFLLTANNLPQDTKDAAGVAQFWNRVRALEPSAIALGTEDFLRGLGNSSGAGRLVDWLRQPSLPFVVSNGAVRLHKPGLNQVSDHGFSLQIEEAASIGWVSDIAMTYPCERLGLRATLVSRGSQDARVTLQPSIGAGRCRARVSFPSLLQPASEYALEIRIDGNLAASFRFHTDELLTPNAWLVPDRPEQPIILTLVDPHVRAMLSDAKWRWRDGDGAKCAAESCEILLLAPIEAYDAVLGLAEPAPTGRPVAVLSQLNDQDTFAVLQHSTRVRFLVLPPDSSALGRAATRTAVSGGAQKAAERLRAQGIPPLRLPPGAVEGPYSGDLGYGAVLNMNTPAATQVWSRPEWFGETVHEVSADVNTETWELTHVAHETHSVKGRALCASSAGEGVSYSLATWQVVNGATVYAVDPSAPPIPSASARYAEMAPDVAFDAAQRVAQGSLWTDLDSFAGAALDAMRTGLNTDLALLPDNAIDENQLVYLREDPHAPTQALSKVFLERVLFRAGTVVRVRVSPTTLFDILNKVLTAGRSEGVGYCVSGLDATGCGSARISHQDTLINGRRLDKNRFYTIAMPEDVALENGLQPYGHLSGDLVELMDKRFARRVAGAVATCAADYHGRPAAAPPDAQDPLPTRLERIRASESSPYLFVKPAEFSFSQTVVGEPPAGQGLFNKLALQNSGAKPSERISTTLGIDLGIFDTRRLAFRALGTIAYGRARVNGQSSTDPNASLAAMRVDWKVPRGRLFAGLFWESQFGDQVTEVTATAKGVTGPTLPLLIRRRDYRYGGFGFELERPELASWLLVDPLRISVASGLSAHEHVDVQIDGQSQSLATFQQLGATGLLNKYFASHPGLASTAPYVFIDQTLRRDRIEIECTPHISWLFGGKSLEILLATTYRRFVGPNAVPLTERQSATLKVTIAVPLYGLATLNLNGSQYLTQVNGIGGWFTVWQPSVSLSLPVIVSRHAGWVY